MNIQRRFVASPNNQSRVVLNGNQRLSTTTQVRRRTVIARLNSGRDNTGVGGGGNPIDSAFTAMADLLVEAIPTSKRSKEAFQFYRSGMQAQSDGKYAEALSNYFQSLRLEIDPYDRSFVLYNIGLIHTVNGEHGRALEYYDEALQHNPALPQALNNIGVIYHYRAEQALSAEQFEVARVLYNKAASYMQEAVRLAPGNYLDVQNWLKNEMGIVAAKPLWD